MKIRDIEDKQIRQKALAIASTPEAVEFRKRNNFGVTDSFSDLSLDTAFDWRDTSEGYDYWKKVFIFENLDSEDKKDELDGRIFPNHYNNENGSLYKIAKQRGWDAYQFDAIKRIDRMYKKGELERDIEKTKTVLDMAKAKM